MSRVKSIHDNVEEFCPKAETCFSYLQVISACIDSFGHGANDVANAISPFAAMLAIYMNESVTKKADTPIWVLAMGGFGIVVGLALFGQYIIRVIGVVSRDYSFTWFYYRDIIIYCCYFGGSSWYSSKHYSLSGWRRGWYWITRECF